MTDGCISARQVEAICVLVAAAPLLVSKNDGTLAAKLLCLTGAALICLLLRAVALRLRLKNDVIKKVINAAGFILFSAISGLYISRALSFVLSESYVKLSRVLLCALLCVVLLYGLLCGAESCARCIFLLSAFSFTVIFFLIVGNIARLEPLNVAAGVVAGPSEWVLFAGLPPAALVFFVLSADIADKKHSGAAFERFLIYTVASVIMLSALSELTLGDSSRKGIYYVYSALCIGSVSFLRRLDVVFYTYIFTIQAAGALCFSLAGCSVLRAASGFSKKRAAVISALASFIVGTVIQ